MNSPTHEPAYPYAEPPARGTSIEVAPGVYWLRMPLPYALDHINLWGLDDGAGWAIVDTGARTDEAVQVWRDLWAHPVDNRPMTRVFVTHMHPDHVGLAGWLTRKFGVSLWMSRLEYLTCRVMLSDCSREAPPDAIAFYQRAGWSESALESYRARFGNFGKHIHPLPDSYRRLSDGDTVRIGANDWRIIVGNGHSPEHACFYCPDLKLLISGDQVLPRISSNVSVLPLEPEANPMADWLASLAKLKREVPDDVLVLPAHGLCFRGLHARIDALFADQEDAQRKLLAALQAQPGMTALDTFSVLFSRPVSEANSALMGMATGEATACLNYLLQAGKVMRSTDAAGIYRYQLTQ